MVKYFLIGSASISLCFAFVLSLFAAEINDFSSIGPAIGGFLAYAGGSAAVAAFISSLEDI